jgi:hypothetical protein
MSRSAFSAMAIISLCLAVNVSAAEGWARLKPGMSRVETVTVVGHPLIRTQGRGFEVWIYDGGAEVVCYRGALVAWTAPAVATATEDAHVETPATEQPNDPAKSPDAANPRKKIHRVYDKFPAFRTEIRL